MDSDAWKKSAEQVLADLQTSELGLTNQEAELRLKTYGYNEVKTKEHRVLEIFLRQVRSPFFYLLVIAAVVSLFVGQPADSPVIMLFIAVNVVIGFFQEFKAERTVALLAGIIAPTARVIRQGKELQVAKRLLVPGDVVRVEAGDAVPAELRVVRQEGLQADESSLTGESAPVAKTAQEGGRNAVLFAGTSVAAGHALAVVTGTGTHTELGSIIISVASQKRPGAYQQDLLYFCRLILRIVTVTILLVFVAKVLLHGASGMFDFLLFCVALIVSILPEALPAVVALSLARGSMAMARQHVVVKRLDSIEDLGNIEVLCSDKTGTLTENKLALHKIGGEKPDEALIFALWERPEAFGLGSPAAHALKINPFDAAVMPRAREVMTGAARWEKKASVPFDSFSMSSSYVLSRGVRTVLVVKGAPESVLEKCLANGVQKKGWKKEIAKESSQGKRVLALAVKNISGTPRAGEDPQDMIRRESKKMEFLGYLVFEDPLKKTSEEAVRLAGKLGVQIKILTGDSAEAATYVARQVGLLMETEAAVAGTELEGMGPDDFDRSCRDAKVFARVSPSMKQRIIRSLQKSYEVGFLGEGINDAPALKNADVGIAVREATDIAREAADVVLLKKDLRVVVEGIRRGRLIFANINKFIKCALASNFGNFYSIAAISLFVNFLPMLPVQILLGNLLSDFPLISISSDSVDPQELRRPARYRLSNVLPLIISLALVSTLFDFIFFIIFFRQPAGQIQTLWFIESILTEIAFIFVIRTRFVFYKARRPGMMLFWFSILDAVLVLLLPFLPLGQTWFHFVAPGFVSIFIIFGIVCAYVALSELVKLTYFRRALGMDKMNQRGYVVGSIR